MKSNIACLGRTAAAGLVLSLLSACVTISPGPRVSTGGMPRSDGYLTASVAPGQSASCAGTPCNIHYRTPDLGRDVTVLANGFVVGTFPSAAAVNLGDYTDTTVRITVQGADVPAAYVNMPNDSR